MIQRYRFIGGTVDDPHFEGDPYGILVRYKDIRAHALDLEDCQTSLELQNKVAIFIKEVLGE